ncbi:hypothetical protein WA026_000106 [Henosepilachna vigintioctopunctata]|uniref:AAA+ ATPase domain-containing protein n=1 Tax=Henosepilachna vigintioctopunctata TaxID=420089 RepID=A0AAW1V667_9CUCU
MSDYPNSDEEFELQYADELELLNDPEDFDEPVAKLPTKCTSRKSLEFGTPKSTYFKTQSDLFSSQSQNSEQNLNTSDSFSNDFHPINETNNAETSSIQNNTQNQNTATISSTQNDQEPTRKRTIEELFGDIDDLLFQGERKTKKAKASTKYEEQLEMIDKILELRKLNQEKDILLLRRNTTHISADEKMKLNISRRVPTYPFIAVTNYDKERFYVRCHSDDYEKEDIARVVKDINLVGTMGDMFKETWKKAQQILNSQLDSEKTAEETDIEEVEMEEDQNLWVDLYKPKRYLELLSDETTNRVLLKWLKLWDKVVFHRRPKIKKVEVDPKNKLNNQFNIENQLRLDEDGRPHFKVALLCGPPGLGKTTLAHVVAKHAGYNVIEINASDDRSLEFFRTSLENATQMRSVVDQQQRPNLVIFDEIDGAPSASVEFLVKFISGSASKGKKKEKDNANILKRPIICICNDAYVPALRGLRQVSFIVNFPPTSSARLSERLIEIARRQHMKTDIGTMQVLAEKSKNDIRSCLSVLHFFKAKDKYINLTDILKASVGQKDMQNGLFSVWNDIFSIERTKVKRFSVPVAAEGEDVEDYDMSYKARMRKILKVVQSFGDYERLAQGVFENYQEMQFKGSTLDGTCLALDWFCYTDRLNQYIMEQQNYSFSVYLPYAFVVWHYQFSSLNWPKIKFPTEAFEARQKLKNNIASIKELEKGLQPKIKIFVNQKILILDVLPSLTRIISPPFRPVNLHLFTAKEKAMFANVVDIMIDYNLNYVQEKNSDGVYEFKLDPDVFPIVEYPKLTTQNFRSLSYFNKQLIAREVEIGKIKSLQRPNDQSVDATKKKKQAAPSISPENDKNIPNHLKKLQVKSLKNATPVVTKDFFGRIIDKEANEASASSGPNIDHDIWFKYKEGYTNAVKKKIKMSQLL